jgi:hypothetical protein
MTVAELMALLARMPPDAPICFREPLDDDGEYETITVTQEWDEVVIDIS